MNSQDLKAKLLEIAEHLETEVDCLIQKYEENGISGTCVLKVSTTLLKQSNSLRKLVGGEKRWE